MGNTDNVDSPHPERPQMSSETDIGTIIDNYIFESRGDEKVTSKEFQDDLGNLTNAVFSKMLKSPPYLAAAIGFLSALLTAFWKISLDLVNAANEAKGETKSASLSSFIQNSNDYTPLLIFFIFFALVLIGLFINRWSVAKFEERKEGQRPLFRLTAVRKTYTFRHKAWIVLNALATIAILVHIIFLGFLFHSDKEVIGSSVVAGLVDMTVIAITIFHCWTLTYKSDKHSNRVRTTYKILFASIFPLCFILFFVMFPIADPISRFIPFSNINLATMTFILYSLMWFCATGSTCLGLASLNWFEPTKNADDPLPSYPRKHWIVQFLGIFSILAIILSIVILILCIQMVYLGNETTGLIINFISLLD